MITSIFGIPIEQEPCSSAADLVVRAAAAQVREDRLAHATREHGYEDREVRFVPRLKIRIVRRQRRSKAGQK